MINLIGGKLQNCGGMAVSHGSIAFQLNMDATIVTPGGIVPASQVLVFQFDGTGNLIQPAQLYSNAELNPQNSSGLATYYLVTIYDPNGARLNKSPLWWQFPSPAGSTVDISSMTAISTIGGNVIYYPQFQVPDPLSVGQITTGELDNVIYVDGVHVTSIAQAILQLRGASGSVICPPGYTETITQQITLGTPTTALNPNPNAQCVVLYLSKGTLLTGDVRNGTDSIFLINAGSGIIGLGAPQGNSNRGGGAVIQLAQTANVANIINTPGTTNNSFFCYLQNLFLDGGAQSGMGTAVIGNAAINLLDMLNISVIKNLLVGQFMNCIGLNVTADNYTSGPLTLDNIWIEGLNLVGARPLVITGHANSGNHANHSITVIGGVVNSAGTGLANIEINGQGDTNQAHSTFELNGVYIESDSGTNNIGIKIADSCNVNIISCDVAMIGTSVTPVGIDISQSGAGLVRSIQIIGYTYVSSGGQALLNHITSESLGTSSCFIPQYFYGDDNTGFRRTIGPVFSNPQALIVGQYQFAARNAADLVIIPSAPATKIPLLIKNYANNQMVVQLDSGASSTEETHIQFLDQGVSQWLIRKSNGNGFTIQDDTVPFGTLVFTHNSVTNLNAGAGSGAVILNQTPNAGTGGLAIYSGGASPLKVANIDSTNGLLLLNAAASQNVIQLANNANVTLKNYADSSIILAIDSGTSATQDTYISWKDQGTEEWRIGKDNGNTFYIRDEVNNLERFNIPQNAHPAAAGVIRLANAEVIGWRNAAGGADLVIKYDSNNDLYLTPNSGFGNGSSGTAMTTTTLGTGTGPTTPQTVVNYLKVNVAGTAYYLPMVQ